MKLSMVRDIWSAGATAIIPSKSSGITLGRHQTLPASPRASFQVRILNRLVVVGFRDLACDHGGYVGRVIPIVGLQFLVKLAGCFVPRPNWHPRWYCGGRGCCRRTRSLAQASRFVDRPRRVNEPAKPPRPNCSVLWFQRSWSGIVQTNSMFRSMRPLTRHEGGLVLSSVALTISVSGNSRPAICPAGQRIVAGEHWHGSLMVQD